VHDPAGRFVDGVKGDGFAVAVGEYPSAVLVEADCCELGCPVGPPAFEHGDAGVVERDGRRVLLRRLAAPTEA
jgi:hypothetical protein